MSEIKIETADLEEVGNNVQAALIDNQLVIVIDTTKNIGFSSTGKMMGIASTGGFQSLPGGMKGNLYIGKKV